MTFSSRRLAAISLASLSLAAATARAGDSAAKTLYDKVAPSFVAVQYTWESEARHTELSGMGIVVSDDGLVMFPLAVASPLIPDEQMKEFKIIVPKVDADHEELDAVFLGRDERANVAFVRLKDPTKKLGPAIKFTEKKLEVGDKILSVGIFPKASGYRAHLLAGQVAAQVRGESHAYVISGDLANVGGVVFDADGAAVGYVMPQQIGPRQESPVFLQDPRMETTTLTRYFVPADEVTAALAAPPKPGVPTPLPFTGIFGMSGLSKDLAEVFNLVGKPAIELGDVVPGTPAAAAGLTKGMIITELDGQPLERGDEPEELGPIMMKKVMKKKPGDTVEFTIIAKKGDAPKKYTVTLGTRPSERSTAKRFYAEDLGFTARDTIFNDFYARKLLGPDGKPTKSGVVVDFIKQSSSAATASLQREDFVTQINNQPVTDLASFKSAYESFRKDKPKDALVLQVLREGSTEIIRIEPPQ
jgi:serine protease Do